MGRAIGLLGKSLLWLGANARMAMLILSLPLLAEFSPGATSIGWAQNQPEMEPVTREIERDQKSYWRSFVTNLTWIEVDSIHGVVRDMQDEGSIANYEFLVQDRGADYAVLIQAEILDVVRWASARGLDVEKVSQRSSDHDRAPFSADTTWGQPAIVDPRQVRRRSP